MDYKSLNEFYSKNSNNEYRLNNPPLIIEAETEAPQDVPPKKKTRKGRLRTVIAAALAVAVIGGGSGYAGVQVAYNQLSGGNDQPSSGLQIPETTTTNSSGEGLVIETNTTLEQSGTQKLSAEDLYALRADSVVAIKLFYTDRRGNETDYGVAGSGVIFTTDGYILTNWHVVSDASRVSVLVTEGDEDTEYDAVIVGMDEQSDIAVLKIEGKGEFSAAPIGDSATLKVGQQIVAIGYPLGYAKSMTMGIVSGLDREIGSSTYELSSIQVDAAINPGNSGGPLFDMYGNIVGICNSKMVMENLVESMGFALSIDDAKPIINELLTYGEITSRPILGIFTIALNETTAYVYGVSVTEGLYVARITAGAPVESSGLAVGDIIIKVNGEYVYEVADVQAITKNMHSGDTITATVVRYDNFGKMREMEVVIQLTSSKELGE